MGEPRATVWPAATEEATGSYVVRRPLGWSMLTTGRPATHPANTTTPFPVARTGVQGVPCRSAPRWPAGNGWGGGAEGGGGGGGAVLWGPPGGPPGGAGGGGGGGGPGGGGGGGGGG